MDATVARYTPERRPERSKNKFRAAVVGAKSKSAVANGRRLHAEARADNIWSRRFRDVFAEITNDLGGPDILSEAQRQLIRRCVTLSIECEKLEGRAVLGEPFDLDQYGMMTDRLGRTFQRLGLKRVARNVNHDLKSYLRDRSDDDGDAP